MRQGPDRVINFIFIYLKNLEQKLTYLFIPTRSPDRKAYVEAFNSILETELITVKYFKNFEEAYESTFRFILFYDNRRLHGSLGNLSPKMFIEGLNNGTITPQVVAV
ncbi:MAG: integrase core domain-containing protein [Bdellovibrionales bacterium]|nr:integrase core domain-containing protein [Bdellovibrionales bacterium]